MQNEIQVNEMRLKLLTKLAKTSYNNSCYETYASLAQLVEQQTLNRVIPYYKLIDTTQYLQ